MQKFKSLIQSHYCLTQNALNLGGIVYSDEVQTDCPLSIALKTLNRHGLIAGATGTGKTKTIQVLSEQLSLQGIPSLVMDMKGDLSGLAMPGSVNEAITKRQKQLQLNYHPQKFPVEFFALGISQGVRLRATLQEFGPLLFAKMLNLNDTQTSVISVLFHYANAHDLLLLDLADIKQLMRFAQGAAKAEIEQQYGGISSASLKAILRKIMELESQGGATLFGEPAFNVNDLIRVGTDGRGSISILRLMDVQDKPKLFSTYMLGLLTQVYREFPEVGDLDKPKLMLFIDEAHLIFANANKALLNKLETMVKLIRSKGVGLVFCTQKPDDIPESILSQLGLKIQHSLRAFTAKDRKAIKLIAENFPPSEFYDAKQCLTALGIGQVLLTALDAKGQPTPLVVAMIRTPLSRMGPLSEAEFDQSINDSTMITRYAHTIDRESAKEVLSMRMKRQSVDDKPQERNQKQGVDGFDDKLKVMDKVLKILDKIAKNPLIKSLSAFVFAKMKGVKGKGSKNK